MSRAFQRYQKPKIDKKIDMPLFPADGRADLHYKLLEIASHDPTDTVIEFLGRSWPGIMCHMTLIWDFKTIMTFWDLALTFNYTKYMVSTLIALLVYNWNYFSQNWIHSELFSGCQPPKCEHVPIFFLFDLTCNVIGDSEVNKNRFCWTTLAGVSNAAWILKIGPVISENGGDYG